MGLEDIIKKVDEVVDQHGDKIKDGLAKAADAIDEKTGGKYSDKIDLAESKVAEQIEKMRTDGR